MKPNERPPCRDIHVRCREFGFDIIRIYLPSPNLHGEQLELSLSEYIELPTIITQPLLVHHHYLVLNCKESDRGKREK